jgi:hypothetical protein
VRARRAERATRALLAAGDGPTIGELLWARGAKPLVRGLELGRLLFLAWLHGGEDPYRLYHGLDEHWRPRSDPDGEPRPPQFPERQRALIFAFASVAHEGLDPRRG